MKKAIWAGLASVLISTSALAANATCPSTPNLQQKLKDAIASVKGQFGLGLNMWATIVAADGRVCAVVNSSNSPIQGQWLASRVISAQKAFTAATLSLGSTPDSTSTTDWKTGKLALSTANLYTATQPGGSLFGLQHSNPVAPANAYGDKINSAGLNVGPSDTGLYGGPSDPMIGQVIGGINVFGGGLGLYDSGYNKVGGVGVSGDTSCTDHLVAWHLRHNINLDWLGTKIQGVAGLFATPKDTKHPDNIIFDIVYNPAGNSVGPYASKSGWGHPGCLGMGEDPEGWVQTNLPTVRGQE
jgi:uncharacterized protein GlcG (DUF336 family)